MGSPLRQLSQSSAKQYPDMRCSVMVRHCGLLFLAISCLSIASQCWGATEGNLACGPRAVCIALQLLDVSVDEDGVRDAFQGRVTGVHSYEEISDAIERLGLACRFVHTDPALPQLARLPVIVGVDRGEQFSHAIHFVVLYGCDGERVQVVDFPHQPRFVPCSRLAHSWDGSGLCLARKERELGYSWLDQRAARMGILFGTLLLGVISSLLCVFARRRRTEVHGS